MIIGIFDSGVGGKHIAGSVHEQFPNHKIIVKEDKDNLPYGSKTKEQLLNLVEPIIAQMVKDGCDVVVIACNTVTTNIINELRQRTDAPLVGIEPMIKPAADISKAGKITVCATPATLQSSRYKWLKNEYAENLEVFEPDCSDWAKMVEDDKIDMESLKAMVDQSNMHGSDVIVLGCTHYHWIFDQITKLTEGKATVLQPTDAVIRQLKTVMKQLY